MAVGSASWSFTEDDYGAITQALHRFLYESNARCALLVDRTGQLVTTVGEQPTFDPTAFATLTAADFSANDQLARLIGETDFNTLFHQGEKESMYLADVARRAKTWPEYPRAGASHHQSGGTAVRAPVDTPSPQTPPARDRKSVV